MDSDKIRKSRDRYLKIDILRKKAFSNEFTSWKTYKKSLTNDDKMKLIVKIMSFNEIGNDIVIDQKWINYFFKIYCQKTVDKDAALNFYMEKFNSETVLKKELEYLSDELTTDYSDIKDVTKDDYLKSGPEILVVKKEGKVIKIMSNDDDYSDSVHELFIGKYATNNHKGFAKVITASENLECPPQLKGIDKCKHVVYEEIKGETLMDWMSNNRRKDLFDINLYNILGKLFSNLYEVNIKYDFTHYDLHSQNVMINEEMEPVIIDFGLSHIKYKDEDFGFILQSGNVTNQSMWFHDIFKILFFCYSELYEDLKVTQTQTSKLSNRNFLRRTKGDKVRDVYASIFRQLVISKNRIKKNRKVFIILEVLRFAINWFLKNTDKLLDIPCYEMINGKQKYKNITDSFYQKNINYYFAPSDEIINSKSLGTFEEFIEYFETLRVLVD